MSSSLRFSSSKTPRSSQAGGVAEDPWSLEHLVPHIDPNFNPVSPLSQLRSTQFSQTLDFTPPRHPTFTRSAYETAPDHPERPIPLLSQEQSHSTLTLEEHDLLVSSQPTIDVVPPSSPILAAATRKAFSQSEDRIQTKAIPYELNEPLLPLLIRSGGLRCETAYFQNLRSLAHESNNPLTSIVDLAAVVVSSSTDVKRAKIGPRDYYTHFRISDPSIWPASIEASIFRPYKLAVPSARAEDVAVLRDFKVIRQRGEYGLISSGSSSWQFADIGQDSAVKDATVSNTRTAYSSFLQTSNEAPTELINRETELLRALYRWYRDVTTSTAIRSLIETTSTPTAMQSRS